MIFTQITYFLGLLISQSFSVFQLNLLFVHLLKNFKLVILFVWFMWEMWLFFNSIILWEDCMAKSENIAGAWMLYARLWNLHISDHINWLPKSI